MNPLVEQSVRHAKRFGDPQTVFETAYADRVDWGLSPTDLGYLAARLRRLGDEAALVENLVLAAREPVAIEKLAKAVGRDATSSSFKSLVASKTDKGWLRKIDGEPARYKATHLGRDAIRKRVPRFKLTDRQKDGLGRLLTEDGVPSKQIATYLGVTRRWVEGRTDYWRAVTEWVREVGVVPGYGIGPPVDLLDAATPPSLYRTLSTILGHRSSSAESTRDRLSTSGVANEKIAVGHRFERLVVVGLERDTSGRKVAVCKCDCGNETTAKPSHLTRGEKQSCGCLRRERMATIRRRGLTAIEGWPAAPPESWLARAMGE